MNLNLEFQNVTVTLVWRDAKAPGDVGVSTCGGLESTSVFLPIARASELLPSTPQEFTIVISYNKRTVTRSSIMKINNNYNDAMI